EARGADVVGVVEAPRLERAGRLGAPVHLVGFLAGTTATSAARREQQGCWQSDEDQALLGRHLTGPSQFEYRRRRRRADDRIIDRGVESFPQKTVDEAGATHKRAQVTIRLHRVSRLPCAQAL